MVICIDFDGTCVSHAYPEIGRDVGAIPVLKALVDAPLYIDDAALGAPLIYPEDGRPFLDWETARYVLINDEII